MLGNNCELYLVIEPKHGSRIRQYQSEEGIQCLCLKVMDHLEKSRIGYCTHLLVLSSKVVSHISNFRIGPFSPLVNQTIQGNTVYL